MSVAQRAPKIKVRTAAPLAVAIACPTCGSSMFPDAGALVCPECTAFELPAPRIDRDEALLKQMPLLWWWANRFVRAGRAGYQTTADEFVQEAALYFLRRWDAFDGVPHHLNKFTHWACQHAARVLRDQNPQPLGPSIAMFERPGDLAAAPEPAEQPDPDDVANALALVTTLPPRWRKDVEAYFGLNGRPATTQRAIAVRDRITSAAVYRRIREAVRRLRSHLRAAG